jgi:hypothetical protein
MKTETLPDQADSFETRLRSGLHHIAAADPIDEPRPFDPDVMRIGVGEQQPRRSLAPMLAAAAAIIGVTVGGLAFFASRTSAPTVADQPTVAVTAPADAMTTTGIGAEGAVLAPVPLPDGYVLYAGASAPDSGTIEGSRAFIYGSPDATPADIVEIVAGDDASGSACDAAMRTVQIGDVEGRFCAVEGEPINVLAAQQLSWITPGGTPVVLLAGADVAEDQVLAIAGSIVVNAPAGTPRLYGDDLTISDLPDGWSRLGYQGATPMTADAVYEIGSATDPAAPTFLVRIYRGTEPGDIWSIMNGQHTSTPVTVRGATGFLENTDELNPFLVWRESDGTIVHIQNNGGTPESILAFAENLTLLDAEGWERFLRAGVDRPTPPAPPADGVATTTTILTTLD